MLGLKIKAYLFSQDNKNTACASYSKSVKG